MEIVELDRMKLFDKSWEHKRPKSWGYFLLSYYHSFSLDYWRGLYYITRAAAEIRDGIPRATINRQ